MFHRFPIPNKKKEYIKAQSLLRDPLEELLVFSPKYNHPPLLEKLHILTSLDNYLLELN